MSHDDIMSPPSIAAVLKALAARVWIVVPQSDGSFAVLTAQRDDTRPAEPTPNPLPGSLDRFRPELAAAVAGTVARWEGWLPNENGRYLEYMFLPPDSGSNHIPVISRDLTTSKRREQEFAERIEALSATQASTAAVVASSLDCIVIVDADGRVLEFNPAAEATFGYARADAIGQPIAELIVPHSMREHHRRGMERYQRTGVPHVLNRRVELEAMRADGSLFPVELSIVELKEARGRCFAAHLRDLTLAKAAQREIERQRLQLHQTEKLGMMASLLGGVAHELNNPMAILLAQATLLQSRAETDDARTRAGKIHSAAERAARIVKSFLTMARDRPSERSPTDIHQVIETAIDMTAYARRGAGIDLLVERAPDLGLVVADPHLLAQVFTTLLVNATQTLSDRPGTRKVRIATAHASGSVTIELDHNGPGLAEDSDGLPDAVPVSRAGSWNGLSVCRDIVQSHGGTLTIGTLDDGKTRFTIALPAAAAAAPDRPVETAADASLSILIVDDERDVADALADMLQIIGHRTMVTDNAADALTRAGDRSVDVIFADLRMPVISGLELYRHVVERRPEIQGRFVLVTGDTVGAFDAMREGAPGAQLLVLEKPFSSRDVRAVLGRARQLDGPAASDRNAADGGATWL